MYRVIYYFNGTWRVSNMMSYEEAKEYIRDKRDMISEIVKVIVN